MLFTNSRQSTQILKAESESLMSSKYEFKWNSQLKVLHMHGQCSTEKSVNIPGHHDMPRVPSMYLTCIYCKMFSLLYNVFIIVNTNKLINLQGE